MRSGPGDRGTEWGVQRGSGRQERGLHWGPGWPSLLSEVLQPLAGIPLFGMLRAWSQVSPGYLRAWKSCGAPEPAMASGCTQILLPRGPARNTELGNEAPGCPPSMGGLAQK